MNSTDMNIRSVHRVWSARGVPLVTVWPIPWGAAFYYRCRLPLHAMYHNGLADGVLLNVDGTPGLVGDVLVFQTSHHAMQLDAAKALRSKTLRILEIDDDLEHRPALHPGLYWQSTSLYKDMAAILFKSRGRATPEFGFLNADVPWLTHAIEACNTVDDAIRVAPSNDALYYHQEIAKECDGVTVSTPRLEAIFSRFNANVWVLPNCLDFTQECYRPENRWVPHDGIIIGWAGGLEHMDDVRLVRPVLADVLARYDGTNGVPRVRLMIGGSIKVYAEALGQLPGVQGFLHKICRVAPDRDLAYGWGEEVTTIESDCGRYLYRPAVPLWHYPLFYQDVDIGIVPNEIGSSYHESKSDLKGLEMAAMGVPIVASPLSEYVRWRSKGTGALLPEGNRLSEWAGMLYRLVEDGSLRRQMAEEALAFAATRTIDRWVHLWMEAYATTAKRCGKDWNGGP